MYTDRQRAAGFLICGPLPFVGSYAVNAAYVSWPGQPMILNEPNPTFTFQKPAQYKAILTVTDAHGLKDSREVE